MSVNVHPTAIVAPGTELAQGVTIGPYAYIGGRVRLGAGTVVQHHATVEGDTHIGERNMLFPYACIGLETQDVRYKKTSPEGAFPQLRIGNDNIFREFSTVHTATNAGEQTLIGSHNYLLAYVHVAHNCTLGDHITISNNSALAGHVVVESHTVIGGFSGVHQFCLIGQYAMVGGYCKVTQDLPPFMLCDGIPAAVRSINKVGLDRGGFTSEMIALAGHIFKTLYKRGRNLTEALEQLQKHPQAASPLIQSTIAFIVNSKRGLTLGSAQVSKENLLKNA